MSKVDAMRAMREARFAASRASTPARASVPAAPEPPVVATPRVTEPGLDEAPAAPSVAPALPKPPAPAPAPAELATEAPEPAEALCGHRNMGGKSCRRPAGHPEKNHRYQ